MRLYSDLASSAVYCAETGVVLAEAPDAPQRIREWRKGLPTRADAARIVASRDEYREVASRFGWKLRNQIHTDTKGGAL